MEAMRNRGMASSAEWKAGRRVWVFAAFFPEDDAAAGPPPFF